MRVVVGALLVSVLGLACGGCMAVSNKEIHTGMRYDAVAVDGKIYLVDKTRLTAREVSVVPCPEEDP